MPSAAALRLEIETALQTRIPGALTPRPRILRDLSATGVPELDALLEGGLPIGAISELVGPQSSGRTTLALATLAELTQAGKTVAWVDTSDALDPESAAAAGINLDHQLWVRCGHTSATSPASLPHNSENHHATSHPAFLIERHRTAAPSGGCGSPHPRAEARGLSEAIDALLQPDTFARPLPPHHHYNQSRKDRSVGTPSAPNRQLLSNQPLDRTPQDPRPIARRAKDREEQIPTDRHPTRRQLLVTQQHTQPQRTDSLRSAQLANTAAIANNRPHPGHWTENANNAAGRAFHTPPNAIAAGLPRFRDMEAKAALTQSEPLQHRVPQVSILRSGFATNQTPFQFPKASRKDTSLAGEPPAKAKSPLWTALDQALRATDLLLSAGGFSAIVLDLGSIPAEFAWRIPLATWFRFRAAADRARTVLLLLTQHPCARSSAELVLRLTPAQPQSTNTVLTGAAFRVTLDRRRFEGQSQPLPMAEPKQPGKLHLVPTRKPPQREAAWHRPAAWTGTQGCASTRDPQ